MKTKMLIPGILFVLVLAFFVSADVCIDNTPPTAPSSLGIADSPYDADGDVTLSWTAASDEPSCSGVDHYNIYRSTNNVDFTKIGETTELSYPDTGLVTGTTYYYYVTAVDKVMFEPHEGPPSNTASTTIGTAPSVSGGGGGSRGGGGGSYTEDDWECGEWSECIDGEKTQECVHKYSSATKTNTVSCVEEETGEAGEETLVETTSSAGEEEEEAGKEVEVLAGGEEEDLGITGAVVGAGGKTPWIFLMILLALIAALLLLLFLRKRRRH